MPDPIETAPERAPGIPGDLQSAASQHDLLLAIGAAALAALALAAIALVVRQLMRRHAVARLDARYPGARDRITRACRIRRARTGAPNAYRLSFPHWQYENKDGTRDRRHRDNRVVWPTCELVIDGRRITCPDPKTIVDLVAQLRASGAVIRPCDLEREKGERLLAEARRLQELDTIGALQREFASRPIGFERYCATLFAHLGYDARATKATGDGGYDIILRGNGVTGIVECKCFAPSHKVGRPHLQKLVGANETVGADRLIFITTSTFSSEALDYARTAGVDCIDGVRLLELRDRAYRMGPPHAGTAPSDADWQLTVDDIAPYYPPELVRGQSRSGPAGG